MLKSRDQAMSAGEKQSNQSEAFTSCKADNKQYQQWNNKVIKQRHSQTGKQMTGNVSREATVIKQRYSQTGEPRLNNVSRGKLVFFPTHPKIWEYSQTSLHNIFCIPLKI